MLEPVAVLNFVIAVSHFVGEIIAAAGLVVAAIGTLIWAACDPRSSLFGPVRWRAEDTARKQVALTFDDGPTAGATEQVLKILAELNVLAAFFVIGRNARRWPELVRQMHEQGHLVGNHSFDHARYGFFRRRKYWDRQLAEADLAVEEITGVRPTLYRPPVGVRTPRMAAAVRQSGHTVVTWSLRGLDGVERTPDYICNRLIGSAKPGDILVLHDGNEPDGRRDPAAMLAAIPMVVAGLRRRGFEFVRLDELLGIPARL